MGLYGGRGIAVANLQERWRGILSVMEVERFVELWFLASYGVIVVGVRVVLVGRVSHGTMGSYVIIT